MTGQQIDRDRLRKLANAATSGPWEATSFESQHGTVTHLVFTDRPMGVGPVGRDEDAEFIAAARQAVPELLDALDQAEDRIDSLRTQIGIEIRSRDEWETNAEQTEARLQAVREEHQQQPGQGPPYCTCDDPWPCDTIRALDGES